MNKAYHYLGFIIIVAIAVIWSVAPLALPAVQPADAPVQEFSAERAWQYVIPISKEIHPAGSEAMKEVVSYLVQSLQTIGLQAEVQDATGRTMLGKSLELHNVVVRIPGTDSTGAVLIMAHPDSTPFGPGAGDDATGAATLLEVIRAVQAGPALKNDIIFLFDDGEEYMYLGGYAFTREHPWMSDVRLVVGIDTAAWGPSVLLQAIPSGKSLIQGYAKAVRQPAAYGAYADYDWTLGHDTALTYPFVEKGIPALDIEDTYATTVKHSPADTMEKIDPRSMQQMGDQTLALAREYGNMDLNHMSSTPESFFTLWGVGLVYYPATINIIFAVLTLVGFFALLYREIRRKAFSGKEFGLAVLSALGMVFISGVLGLASGGVFELLFPKPNPHIDKYLVPTSLPFFIISLALVIALYLFLRGRAVRRVSGMTIAFAGLVPWIVFSLVFVIIAPVGSYIFVLPTVIGLIAWSIVLTVKSDTSPLRPALLTIPLIAGILLIVPNLVLMYISTGIDIWLTAMTAVMMLDLGMSVMGMVSVVPDRQ